MWPIFKKLFNRDKNSIDDSQIIRTSIMNNLIEELEEKNIDAGKLHEEKIYQQFIKLSLFHQTHSSTSSESIILSEEKVNNHFSKLFAFYQENAYAIYMLGEKFDKKLEGIFDISDDLT